MCVCVCMSYIEWVSVDNKEAVQSDGSQLEK